MTREEALALASEIGFTHSGIFLSEGLRFRQEVRDMCRADKCAKFGRQWTCPPACGSLEEISERAKQYSWGVLLQTTAYMEDAFDGETMMEAMEQQAERVVEYFRVVMQERKEDCLPMGSGGCPVNCTHCTYPDAPCRHPDKAFPSMEAYGLIVSDTCKLADLPYYYGKDTITFTACVLFP